ncbi:type II toxin-antitoxin system HigB family toxin [Pseudoxanthomonas mexicana]|uniref:type II toxin-antitoxin system HigB family toxin n=1 Tax=Pseudoxanthomonas mexicana TaxID=128785 RepID=UPI001FD6D790|nr:type II toxin-antitoxin system HigB family toxin [Pseudoxanthomonas mexicana]UOV01494.1 type II toxin-antitoxin system HigB family toxin [Pseudoxanthomonas mexicana]
MKVIAVGTLRDFWSRHPDAEQPLKAWYDEAKHAVWRTPQDVRQRYASASFVGHNRVVFNIKGNDYRLIVAVAYRFQAIYIKFIGTHTEYDRVDAATVEAP